MGLSRRHNFLPGTFIRASEITDEWDQIIQFLTGVINGTISLRTTLAQPCLILKNQRAGQLVLDCKQGSVSKFQIDEDLAIISLVTDVAPFIVTSVIKVVGLDAQYLDDLPITAFLTTGKKVDQYIPFYFDGIPVAGQISFDFIVPAGTTMLINDFIVSSSVRLGLYPGISDSADLQATLKKNGVTVTSIVISSPTYSGQASVFSTSVVENDVINIVIDSITGLEPPRNIQARVRFRQTLV